MTSTPWFPRRRDPKSCTIFPPATKCFHNPHRLFHSPVGLICLWTTPVENPVGNVENPLFSTIICLFAHPQPLGKTLGIPTDFHRDRPPPGEISPGLWTEKIHPEKGFLPGKRLAGSPRNPGVPRPLCEKPTTSPGFPQAPGIFSGSAPYKFTFPGVLSIMERNIGTNRRDNTLDCWRP